MPKIIKSGIFFTAVCLIGIIICIINIAHDNISKNHNKLQECLSKAVKVQDTSYKNLQLRYQALSINLNVYDQQIECYNKYKTDENDNSKLQALLLKRSDTQAEMQTCILLMNQ